ncbi:hypothetical protein ENH_00047250, partial [Eimeria necatrix]
MGPTTHCQYHLQLFHVLSCHSKENRALPVQLVGLKEVESLLIALVEGQ